MLKCKSPASADFFGRCGIGHIASVNGSETAYYNFNAHGDVVQSTDDTGVVTKNYRYDAFGVEQGPDPADTNPWRYCGEYFDVETGTIYLRARYYDPVTSRMLSEDSVHYVTRKIANGQELIDPLSLNLYTYCVNNPILYVDPSGYVIELSSTATKTEREQYDRAIAYLKTSKDGKALIKKLEDSKEKIIISFIKDHNDQYLGSPDGTIRIISWDPTSGLVMSNGTSIQSAALGLAHEMGHAAQHLDGTYFSFKSIAAREANNLSKYETPIAEQLGEPIRQNYSDATGAYRMNNSTHYRTTHTLWRRQRGESRTYTVDHNAT